MASCMMHAKSLPHKLWAGALNCVNYIQNRSPHRSIKDQSPFEAWSDTKPKITHLRVFGSRAWARFPYEKRKALDPQSIECIVVGYPDDTLYLPHVRDDDSVHSDVDTDHADAKEEHADAETESSDTNLVHANDDPHPSPDRASSSESYTPVINREQGAYSSDTQSYVEAAGYPSWESAMEEEYNSLLKNLTWDLVPLPSGRKLVRCKWVYRTKSAANAQITRWKTRLVAKGFQQAHGIDYDETFAPVAKMDSICLTLSLTAA
eukprot:PITA_10429